MITGDEIRDRRHRADLSQEELAKLVGVSPRTVGNWERGSTVPRAKEQALREVLGDQPAAGGDPLAGVTDIELLAEVARRMARGERREGGGGDDRDAAPMNESDGDRDAAADVRQLPTAARRAPSQGKALRAHLDQVGEDSQDPGDLEPR